MRTELPEKRVNTPVAYQNPQQKDYSKCDVCGLDLDTDRLHVMVDNGYLIRNVFCCRHHRYVEVEFNGKVFVQERTDRELEHLATKYRQGLLETGWE